MNTRLIFAITLSLLCASIHAYSFMEEVPETDLDPIEAPIVAGQLPSTPVEQPTPPEEHAEEHEEVLVDYTQSDDWTLLKLRKKKKEIEKKKLQP